MRYCAKNSALGFLLQAAYLWLEGLASSSTMNDPWASVGGGAVNEKTRTYQKHEESYAIKDRFQPSTNKAHLWHSLEGLERYPNYLSRWQEDDMISLEQALEEKLRQVRQQRKSVMERRKEIDRLVQQVINNQGRDGSRLRAPKTWQQVQRDILDPQLSKAIFRSATFRGEQVPTVDQILSGEAFVELDVGLLSSIMDEEVFDVFSIPLLQAEFCSNLRHYINALFSTGQTDEFVDLGVGLRPIDLDTVGLKWLNDLLFHLIVRPIARHLFRDSESLGDLDWRHGYIAAYSAKPDRERPRNRLVTHTDDSEVTLNIGLGENFVGGVLEFRGLRGTEDGGHMLETFEPVEGTALLHAGRHFHHVTAVKKGNRYALIMWSRSWRGARSVACPCCWLNRRRDEACICGPRWN
mmetsp:Transcript_10845/g.24324  ORF Transcript_10845/g.24324 Transcript_10845/m.24324 type:complete len:409 (+) Transcript_10845:46-1272(+)